jgi:Rod binding domain-containing protein
VEGVPSADCRISENIHTGNLDKTRARDIQLRKKSTELEALFITQLFKAMEKTVPDGGLHGSKRNNLPSMLFSSVMGDAVAKQGGVGLSEMIYNSLKEKESFDPDLTGVNDSFLKSYNVISTMESLNDE